MIWSDLVGWGGFVIVLGSYFMVALHRWRVCSIKNQIGNILGPSLLSINSYEKMAIVPLILNILWAFIAITTLSRLVTTSGLSRMNNKKNNR